jgi:hypothetical protein
MECSIGYGGYDRITELFGLSQIPNNTQSSCVIYKSDKTFDVMFKMTMGGVFTPPFVLVPSNIFFEVFLI